MARKLNLDRYGITVKNVIRNASPSVLYELAVSQENASLISSGALAVFSGEKTGRVPKDKRVVDHPESRDEVWWGEVNIPLQETSFLVNRQRARDYLSTRDYLYVLDGFAGWDPKYRVKVRVICTMAYHALFMHNMLIRPTHEELDSFGEPDFVIYNAGEFPANPYTPGMTSRSSVALSVESRELVILGTQYAGEMKKGVFTLMNYLMPKRGVLSMHCSANQGESGDVSLFFGLSGTGKTTLSADPRRDLIGDDEHCWSADGIFNIEGGCYAKCVNLSEESEPEIYRAIRFGSVLENVVFQEDSRRVDFHDVSITENTRTSYPIEFIDHAKIPCVGPHPEDIIFLTCDAFGVLPPVSKLTPSQAQYHFLSGYTAKVAGTEVGITEPEATFSACFGAAFLMFHPAKYSEMLADKMKNHHAKAWLINTGWTGGSYGIGSRIKLEYTRAIIDAIHNRELDHVDTDIDSIFGLAVPKTCPGVPADLLHPKHAWKDQDLYNETAQRLADLFHENFTKYSDFASNEVIAAGPLSHQQESESPYHEGEG